MKILAVDVYSRETSATLAGVILTDLSCNISEDRVISKRWVRGTHL